MKLLLDKIYSKDNIVSIIKSSFIPLLSRYSIVFLHGPLGVGKTKFVQAFLSLYDIKNVVSPTFSYVCTYHLEKFSVHHFDLYRMKNEKDFMELGFCEYLFDQGNVVFIEWPEILEKMVEKCNLVTRVLVLDFCYLLDDVGKRHLRLYLK